jgi:hypothetical protein
MSSIPLSLTGTPKFHLGFWHSYGTTLPAGPMLTIATFWFKFISAGVALLIAWVLTRLWRSLSSLIFYITFHPTRNSVQDSQSSVLLVNSEKASSALFASLSLMKLQKPRARQVAILILSSLIFAFGAAIPVLVAQIPTYNLAPVVSDRCASIISPSFQNITAKEVRWADAALSTVNPQGDISLPGISSSSLTSPPPAVQSFTSTCPPQASVCDPEFPFTFSSNYTLQARHFGLNLKTPFSLQVSDTCYRAQLATAPLPLPNATTVLYGLYYGPISMSLISSGSIQAFTESYFLERILTPSYTLSSHAARANDILPPVWEPNSTLVLGGDTTALFYYVGGVSMFQASDDPIFPTLSIPVLNTTTGEIYDSDGVVSPVMCDTKYIFCVGQSGHCSPLGGITTIIKWLESQSDLEARELGISFEVLLAYPPIYLASHGSSAILASETVDFWQLDPSNANTTLELGRLARGGRAMITSAPQLTAGGYFDLTNQATPTNNSLCSSVLIDVSNAVTVPVIPYCILLVISFVIAATSYSTNIPFLKRNKSLKLYADSWALHYAGQLHREVIEQLYGRFDKVNTTARWPAMGPECAGPDVVNENGSERFVKGQSWIFLSFVFLSQLFFLIGPMMVDVPNGYVSVLESPSAQSPSSTPTKA